MCIFIRWTVKSWKVKNFVDCLFSDFTVFIDSVLKNISIRPKINGVNIETIVVSIWINFHFLSVYPINLLKLLGRNETRVEIRIDVQYLIPDTLWNDILHCSTMMIQWHVRKKLLEEVLRCHDVLQFTLGSYLLLLLLFFVLLIF